MNTNSFIFLDLDGVLHRAHHPGELTIATAGIEELLEQRPDLFGWSHHLADALEGHRCDLIVHSSWRAYMPDTDLRAVLPSCIRHRFAGTTRRNVAREDSILMAARAMALDDDAFLVVDDEPDQFETLRHRLVVCDPAAGLTTPGAIQEITDWLKRPVTGSTR
jgi:hypothetical protein